MLVGALFVSGDKYISEVSHVAEVVLTIQHKWLCVMVHHQWYSTLIIIVYWQEVIVNIF